MSFSSALFVTVSLEKIFLKTVEVTPAAERRFLTIPSLRQFNRQEQNFPVVEEFPPHVRLRVLGCYLLRLAVVASSR